MTNVVGGPRGGSRPRSTAPGRDGDVLLLCSDGLSEPVGDAKIAEVLAETDAPEAACDRLIDLALEGGGPGQHHRRVARYE